MKHTFIITFTYSNNVLVVKGAMTNILKYILNYVNIFATRESIWKRRHNKYFVQRHSRPSTLCTV